MNSLSWMLYLIDTVGNVKSIFIGLLFFTAIAWVVLNILVPFSEGEILTWVQYKKWWWRGVVSTVVLSFCVAAIPSKTTMYAIAASQVGEKVTANETVQGLTNDATKALQQWIKKQIAVDDANGTPATAK